MKKHFSKVITGILAAVLLLSAVPAPIQAASTPNMKAAKVSWDLKADKQLTFQSYWAGVGYKNHKVLVKNMKISDAKKKGYKKLTFSMVMDSPEIKQSEVHKICTSDYAQYVGIGGDVFYTLTDYKTGQCLEVENDKNVTVTATEFKNIKKKTLTDKDGCTLWYYRNAVIKNVTVVYPEDYKDLCLIVGGHSKSIMDNPSKDDSFWEGSGKFSKTSMNNVSGKKIAHAMRIK